MPPTGQELVDAAWNGQLSEVKRLLADAGAPSINWVDTYSRSGLHHAALGGHLNVVKYLLENGAKCSLKDNGGKTAADLAGSKRVKALLNTEANKGAINLSTPCPACNQPLTLNPTQVCCRAQSLLGVCMHIFIFKCM